MATDVEQSKHVIRRDRWDVEDWAKARTDVSTIETVEEKLNEVAWTGARLLSDVYTSLHKAGPDLVDEGETTPSYKPNRRVMSELMDEQSWRDLREYTVGDQFTAGLAVTKMAEQLLEMLQRTSDAQKKADEAEAKAQEFIDGCVEAGVDPGDGDAIDQMPGLRDMRAEAEHAEQSAADALDKAAPNIGRAARTAAADALDEVSDQAAQAAGWDLSPGELSKMDPTLRLQLAARLSTDRMRKIADLLGRLRNELWATDSARWDNGPDEIADITLSDDLNRLVGTELLSLCVPELEVDFLDRFTRKHLLTYEMRSRKKEAKGGIIYVEDNSSSMYGEPEIWARSVGLALLDVAAKQGRSFRAIVFSGTGSVVEFDFGGGTAVEPTFEQRLAYAEFQMGGGTEFAAPLTAAVAHLQAEYDDTGRTTGDIVFATDGDASPEYDFWVEWAEARDRLGFRCWGIAVAMGVTPTLSRICDRVTEVHKLTDGSAIRGVFEDVTAEKVPA